MCYNILEIPHTPPLSEQMKTKRKLLRKKRFWATIILLLGVIWCVITYKNQDPWYTAYEGPAITIDIEGEAVTTPLRTWKMLHRTLVEIDKDAPSVVAHAAIPVAKHLNDYMQLLANELPVGRDKHIDFIAMIHISTSDPHGEDQSWANHVQSSQTNVFDLLAAGSYDAIGKEGSWLTPFNESSLVNENVGTLRFDFPRCTKQQEDHLTEVVKKAFANANKTDGVMRYAHSTPSSFVIGAEDEHIYRLHSAIASLLYTPSLGNYNTKAKLQTYDRILVWLRTEIAVAKTLRTMRENGKSRGVIVMGQAHRHSFELLARQIGLKSTIFHTVPEKVRSDEP